LPLSFRWAILQLLYQDKIECRKYLSEKNTNVYDRNKDTMVKPSLNTVIMFL